MARSLKREKPYRLCIFLSLFLSFFLSFFPSFLPSFLFFFYLSFFISFFCLFPPPLPVPPLPRLVQMARKLTFSLTIVWVRGAVQHWHARERWSRYLLPRSVLIFAVEYLAIGRIDVPLAPNIYTYTTRGYPNKRARCTLIRIYKTFIFNS